MTSQALVQVPEKSGPLTGIRVLDIATFIAAPYAATLMAEFGADVVKVELPGSGDPARRFGSMTECGETLPWLSESRNKRSIALDLRTPAGAATLKQLAAVADVVCENFQPGTLARSCQRGAAMGFQGKLCIHPDQLSVANAAFGPAPADVERAHRIVAAFASAEAAGAASIQVDGRFVDYPIVARAQRLLRLAEQRTDVATANAGLCQPSSQ